MRKVDPATFSGNRNRPCLRSVAILLVGAFLTVTARAQNQASDALEARNIPAPSPQLEMRMGAFHRMQSVRGVRWCEGNGAVYFTRSGDGESRIYRVIPGLPAVDLVSPYERVVRGFELRATATGSQVTYGVNGSLVAITGASRREEQIIAGLQLATFAWSPDGKRLACTDTDDASIVRIRTALGEIVASRTERGLQPLRWIDKSRVLLRRDTASGAQFWQWNPDSDELSMRLAVTTEGAVDIAYVPAIDSAFFIADTRSFGRSVFRAASDLEVPEQVVPNSTWDVEEFAVSPDGTQLAYVSNEAASGIVYLEALSSREPRRVATERVGVAYSLTFDEGGDRLFFAFSKPTRPAEIYECRVGSGACRRITDGVTGSPMNANAVDYSYFASRTDGRSIQAFAVMPPTPGPHPVLLDMHGGPIAQARPYFHALRAFLVYELGIAIVVPNIRGSAGFGADFAQLDNGMKRIDAIQDVGALFDRIASDPRFDAGRVGIIGGSYGGFVALAAMVQYPQRVRVGVCYAGVSDLGSFMDFHAVRDPTSRRLEYGDERDPAVRAQMRGLSVLQRTESLLGDLLLVHGAQDANVPIDQADRLYEQLTTAGREPWYLRAANQGHTFRRGVARQRYRLAVAQRLAQSFGVSF